MKLLTSLKGLCTIRLFSVSPSKFILIKIYYTHQTTKLDDFFTFTPKFLLSSFSWSLNSLITFLSSSLFTFFSSLICSSFSLSYSSSLACRFKKFSISIFLFSLFLLIWSCNCLFIDIFFSFSIYTTCFFKLLKTIACFSFFWTINFLNKVYSSLHPDISLWFLCIFCFYKFFSRRAFDFYFWRVSYFSSIWTRYRKYW